MKQNKNYSAVIRVASATLAAFVLFFSLCIPSFATAVLDFDSQPLVTLSSSSTASQIRDGGSLVALSSSNDRITYAGTDDTKPIYCFGYQSSSSVNICLASETFQAPFVAYLFNSKVSDSCGTSDQTNNLYYKARGTFDSSYTINVPVYSTLAEGLSALRSFIDNPPSSVTPHELTISLPAGQSIYIDINGLSGVTGSLSTQTNKSFSSPHSWNPSLSYTDSISNSGVIQGSAINWNGTGGKDLFGRYSSWSCNLIVQPNKKYIAVYNPFMDSAYLDDQHESNNYPISIHVSSCNGYQFVSLNAQYTTGEGIVNTSTDENGYSVWDDENQTWTTVDSEGDPYVPASGGTNTTVTGATINDWLQNIAHSISGFFAGAIGAVTTLVNAGSAFINQLIGLYSWLPAPVYSVLSAALILVITIGVIKVFV